MSTTINITILNGTKCGYEGCQTYTSKANANYCGEHHAIIKARRIAPNSSCNLCGVPMIVAEPMPWDRCSECRPTSSFTLEEAGVDEPEPEHEAYSDLDYRFRETEPIRFQCGAFFPGEGQCWSNAEEGSMYCEAHKEKEEDDLMYACLADDCDNQVSEIRESFCYTHNWMDC